MRDLRISLPPMISGDALNIIVDTATGSASQLQTLISFEITERDTSEPHLQCDRALALCRSIKYLNSSHLVTVKFPPTSLASRLRVRMHSVNMPQLGFQRLQLLGLEIPESPCPLQQRDHCRRLNRMGQCFKHQLNSCGNCLAGFKGKPPPSMERCTTEVLQECVMGDWSGWSPCSTTCGVGLQKRTRLILQHPHERSPACPPTTDRPGLGENKRVWTC